MKQKQRDIKATVMVLAVISVCVTGILYGFLKSGRETFFGEATDFIFRPVQTLFLSGKEKAGDYFEAATNAAEVLSERDRLVEENAALSQENRALISLREENNRLRKLLEMKENSPQFPMVACEILARDNGSLSGNFVINQGKESGISVNDAVVSQRALVGKVVAVSRKRAICAPITQKGIHVSARSLRTQRLFLAEGQNRKNSMDLSFFEEETWLGEGDTVETSGMGGIFPEGLLLGVVRDVKKDEKGRVASAILESAVEMGQLREVAVILSGGEVAP